LLLALIAILSNAGFFLVLPGQRAIPWLSVGLAIAALFCAAVGIMRAFRQSQVYKGKTSSAILGGLSLLICGLVAIAAVTSRALPTAAGAPQVGQKVPGFTLADTNGNKVSLDQLLGKGEAATKTVSLVAPPANQSPTAMSTAMPTKAVLLVFYRGYWWPFCNLELRGIQKNLKEFEAAGVRPVAISVDTPEVSRNLATKAGYTFPILSDPTAETISRYNLLHKGGGPEGSNIARPAEFLVDTSGTVRWTNFTEDVRIRAKADEMLAAARGLK
jgi:peroxiredoxin